ncbi:MAG: toll/interleukin-1 receptor domain-containing protein [Chloroflexi bacterium]|nr:toll/interleukin-1 receptor domain-containing protein [Chloroflexota bacterium]
MSVALQPTKTIEIFYSYAREDEELRNELEKHLSILKRQGVLAGWHDRKISPGKEWKDEIDMHLNTARIILLLISADFMASDYCWGVEVERAMERHKAGEARVIPVILRPVDWKGAPFGKLQALPTDAEPVTSWKNRDEAFVDIAQGIRAVVKELTTYQPASITAPVRAVPYIPEPQVGEIRHFEGQTKEEASDPRWDIMKRYLDIGYAPSALNIVRDMCKDNPEAAIKGYELVRAYYLSIGYLPSAESVAREMHEFKKSLSRY